MELKEIKCKLESVGCPDDEIITIALDKDSVISDDWAGDFAEGYRLENGRPYIGLYGLSTPILPA